MGHFYRDGEIVGGFMNDEVVSEGQQPDGAESSVEDTANVSNEDIGDNGELSHEAKEEEKVLKQSEVNKIVGNTRKEAYERARRDIETAQQQQQQVESFSDTSYDGASLTSEQVKQLVKKEADDRVQQIEAEKTATQFVSKCERGISKYNDFSAVVEPLDILNAPYLAELTNQVDNTEDVLYEVGKNPNTEAALRTLALTNPKGALKMVEKISNSIKKNQEASKQKNPNEPLDELKPSNTGADNDSMSINDLTKSDAFKV